jgi:hypothetical protein
MYPTQLTTLLFITNIAHAYIKQNSPIFFSALPLYTTSIIYHYTKHSMVDSTTTVLCKVDMFLCGVYYFSALYDYLTRNTIRPPYSTMCLGLHIALPLSFIMSARYNTLIWSPDIQVSEAWHAIFHLVIIAYTQIYLYAS